MTGRTVSRIRGLMQYSPSVAIDFEDGSMIIFHHNQDCCESVLLEDFDYTDLVGSTITSALEIIGGEESPNRFSEESHTWTFYRIRGTWGDLWMRWLGESNGFYSERVDIEWFEPEDEKTQY